MGSIYKITNRIDNSFYVGKTTQTLEERFQDHRYSVRYDSQTHLHRAMRRFGEDNFSVELIESCDDSCIDQREQYWIKTLNPRYNMTSGGEGGDTSQTQSYRDGMKKRRSYAGEGNPNYGKRYPKKVLGPNPKIAESTKKHWDEHPERKEKARLNALGNKNGFFNKKQSRPVEIDGVRYNSIGQAAKQTGLTYDRVRKIGKFI